MGYNRAMLVLASNSPRRRELLSLLGIPFTVHAVEVDESPLRGEHPREYVSRLSRQKAEQAVAQLGGERLVLAADTTVALEEHAERWEILGKPQNVQEAAEMLRRLRGRTHFVFTGIALCHIPTSQLWTDVCVSEVPMRNYSDAEMQAYIASGDPFDKAGGYAIQHRGFHPVENFTGCFANVMGLPLCQLARLLARAGIEVDDPLAPLCVRAFAYLCPLAENLAEE
ncbi:MAG: Maf family protein [Anaerolineales bacterium]